MKLLLIISIMLSLLAIISACSTMPIKRNLPPLKTVSQVDIAQYLGVWHEIARYPNSFQKGCAASTARYSLLKNGDIEVINSCNNERDGSIRQARGRAWVVDTTSNAKLKVSFFWPFRGDYWIIELGTNYEYAVIGTPDRNYFWILSRSPQLSDELYEQILQRAALQGFLPAKVIRSTVITPGSQLTAPH